MACSDNFIFLNVEKLRLMIHFAHNFQNMITTNRTKNLKSIMLFNNNFEIKMNSIVQKFRQFSSAIVRN